MKRLAVRCLLAVLNSRWLNSSPCPYAYVGNVDNFSREYLAAEEKQRPGVTVRTILEEAARFRACPIKPHGVTVLQDDNPPRDATIWDLHELRSSFSRKEQKP